MQNWSIIRNHIEKILQQQKYKGSGNYNGTQCFLSAYQLAVLVDREDSTLKGPLPIGGKGVGPNSFAREIAWNLSKDINDFDNNIEIQFLSLDGLDSFTFNGSNIPSEYEFSMFRWKNQTTPSNPDQDGAAD